MRYPHGDLHHGPGDVFDRQLPHDSGAFDSFDDVHVGNNWGHTARAAVENQAAVGGRAEALRRFAAERTMKTGTTIAGVVFEVRRLTCGQRSCTACQRSEPLGRDCRT